MSDLLLDVSQMREADARIERTVSADALAVDSEDFKVQAPVRLTVDVHKDGRRFRLTGRVAGTLDLECSRCLVPFQQPVDDAFDVLYLPRTEGAHGGEAEIEDDDLSTAYFADEVIDLGQLIVEQFFMAVPMKPLCGDGCRGLCPLCGMNLNTGSCSCTAEWEDPRLAVLRELKKDK